MTKKEQCETDILNVYQLLIDYEGALRIFKNDYPGIWSCFSDDALLGDIDAASKKLKFIHQRVLSMKEKDIQ